MAKQQQDAYTGDLFGRKPVGRPRNPNAKTVKQRVRECRERKKQFAISVTGNENSPPIPCVWCGAKKIVLAVVFVQLVKGDKNEF